MGYDVHFSGQFNLDKPLTHLHWHTLRAFSEERHEGTAFPGYYCHWIPNDEGTALIHNDSESFSGFADWLTYLIATYLKPWGYTVNGTVTWQGHDVGDYGTLSACENAVQMIAADEERKQLKSLVVDALHEEGPLHKQWYLWQIAKLLGIEHEIDAEEGVAP